MTYLHLKPTDNCTPSERTDLAPGLPRASLVQTRDRHRSARTTNCSFLNSYPEWTDIGS
jgi:hypothetical protein